MTAIPQNMKTFFFALAFFSGSAQSEVYTRMNSTDCPSPRWSFKEFSEKLMDHALKKEAMLTNTRISNPQCPPIMPHVGFPKTGGHISNECIPHLVDQWTPAQYAVILDNMNRLMGFFREKAGVCKGAIPAGCPAPAVHVNGGLVCVSSEERRFCKPMCNEGYDFSFMRTSRLYEECSNTTDHKWTTQYIGGNKLAECNESNVQISGSTSAYFPKDQDCWKTKSEQALEKKIIKFFKDELSAANIKGPFTHSCVLCG